MTDKLQILIADDDRDLLDMLALRCNSLGLDVITATDAMDALANADFYAPDIALLDVRMPGGNGISVSEMLASQDRFSSTKVIMMTGESNETIRTRCLEMGAKLVIKDHRFWERLEPILTELIEEESQSPSLRIDELTDRGIEVSTTARPSVQSMFEEWDQSVFSMFEDWNWVDQVGKPSEAETNDEEVEPTPWILAIDDDPDFTLGLQRRLLSVGVNLVRAYRGMEGYRAAFKGSPKAILLDYQMPDGDGEYILRRLKESPLTSSVPVIVITGMGDAPLKRRMLASGANEFLHKPVRWERLKRALIDYTDINFQTHLPATAVSMA